jgi:hypothetical protein
MTFQTHYRIHTLPMYETPRQLHLPLKLPIILRPLLTLVSYLVYILFYFILSSIYFILILFL